MTRSIAPADDAVAQVKARVSIVEVVQQYVRLRKQGSRYLGLCPFHQEKTPSFNVNEQRQAWHCFGCSRGGTVFDFVMEAEKTDFRGALEILAERAGVELARNAGPSRERAALRRRVVEMNRLAVQYYEYVLHEHRAGEPGRRLLAERQVSDETARRFGLGYAPGGESFGAFLRRRDKPLGDAVAAGLVRSRGRDFFEERLLVPIRDERGQPLAFTGRTVRKDEPRKYVNSPENPAYVKGRVLFALDLAREEIGRLGQAVLMEGQFDVIAGHQHGVQNAVASSGTALTEEQVQLLRRFTDEVMVVFDSDSAGRTAAFKAIEAAAAQGMRTTVVSLPEGEDPDEFLRGAGAEASQRWASAAQSAVPGWEFWIRESVAGLNPARGRDFEIALGRVNGVLARIGDPALRERYRERAAAMMGVEPHLIQVRPGRQRAPRRAGGGDGEAGGLGAVPAGKELSNDLRYLLQVLAVRPEAVARVRSRLRPEHLDEDERGAFLTILDTLERGGIEALQKELEGYPPAERVAIQEALAVEPPAVGDPVVDEIVTKLHRKFISRRRHEIARELDAAEAGRDRARVAQLESELQDLGKKTPDQNVLTGEGG